MKKKQTKDQKQKEEIKLLKELVHAQERYNDLTGAYYDISDSMDYWRRQVTELREKLKLD